MYANKSYAKLPNSDVEKDLYTFGRPEDTRPYPFKLSDAKVEGWATNPNIATKGTLPSNPTSSPILLLAGTVFMFTWPWLFFGIVWAQDGLQLNNYATKVARDNPHATTYLITLIGHIVSMIVGLLFSSAVTCLSKTWVPKHQPLSVFHVLSLADFKDHKSPLGLRAARTHMSDPKKFWVMVLPIAVCFAAFTNVTSSTTSLITPVQFNRTVTLQGTELDFASNDPDCLNWFNGTTIPNTCDWKTFNGLTYTNCLVLNQLVDVLESGRGNILSLVPNNSQSLTLSQLGGQGGLHFLGSIRGVLPSGPDGAPAFNTLQDSPFSDPKTTAGMISYNYTLENQGLISNISCIYDTESRVDVSQISPNEIFVLQYDGSCEGASDVLTNVEQYITLNSNNTLTFWACKSAPNGTTEPSYTIYLRGLNNYESSIGNITCTVSPIQPAIFPVMYHSVTGLFSANKSISTSPTTFPGFMDNAVAALGDIILQAQASQSNLVAESVFTLGVKDFGQPPYVQNEQYLQLFEAMIQGMLEYQATYIRLIYSTGSDRPASCNRTVNGLLSYQVFGWTVEPEHIGFLMPMTIINLVSLLLLLTVVFIGQPGGNEVDPTNPRELIYSRYTPDDPDNSGWHDKVTFTGRVATNPVPVVVYT